MDKWNKKIVFIVFSIIALMLVWKLPSKEPVGMGTKMLVDVPEKLPENVFRDFLPHACEMVRIGGGLVNPGSLARIESAWWACKKIYEDMKQSRDCLVYGLGSGSDVSFDEQLAGIGCEVHSFDIIVPVEKLFVNAKDIFSETFEIQNVRSWKHNKWNWHYHLIGLGGSDDLKDNILSLPTIMKSLKHETRIIDVLKMDIEGAEYSLMKDIEATADRIKTFIGEWHPFYAGPRDMHINAYNSLRQMETKGFRIFRRDFRYDFISPSQLASLSDTHPINYELYLPMSIMGELYFVNIKFLPI